MIKGRMTQAITQCGDLLLLLLFSATPLLAAEANNQIDLEKLSPFWVIGSIASLSTIIGVFIWYMYDLQRRFFTACEKEKQMSIFIQAPFGLPTGSVRTFIALIIVTVSLYFVFLGVFFKFPFPEGLTTLLGTVIGFYFGSRSGAGKTNEGLEDQVQDLKKKNEEVVAQKDESQAAVLIKKVEAGIALSQVASNLLPESMRKKYGEMLGKLQEGVSITKQLSTMGDQAQAVQKGGELLGLFKSDNPVKDIFVKASQSFGQVLGGSVPPVALILAIVGVGTKLVGVTYQKWKARILYAPFSPAVIPLEIVDANTGFALFLGSPIFRSAFEKELEGNERPFMTAAIQDFLREENMELLWQKYEKYHDRFESRERFEAGLEEFRRNAANAELARTIDPKWLAEVGGYEPLMKAVDQIHHNGDQEALASLDAVIMVAEGLQRNNQPASSIFEKVAEEVSK